MRRLFELRSHDTGRTIVKDGERRRKNEKKTEEEREREEDAYTMLTLGESVAWMKLRKEIDKMKEDHKIKQKQMKHKIMKKNKKQNEKHIDNGKENKKRNM